MVLPVSFFTFLCPGTRKRISIASFPASGMTDKTSRLPFPTPGTVIGNCFSALPCPGAGNGRCRELFFTPETSKAMFLAPSPGAAMTNGMTRTPFPFPEMWELSAYWRCFCSFFTKKPLHLQLVQRVVISGCRPPTFRQLSASFRRSDGAHERHAFARRGDKRRAAEKS